MFTSSYCSQTTFFNVSDNHDDAIVLHLPHFVMLGKKKQKQTNIFTLSLCLSVMYERYECALTTRICKEVKWYAYFVNAQVCSVCSV